MRFGLDRMRRLMTALGHPQRRFESIHVVGTNGKSSTVRMIAAILERHGLRTGCLPVAAPGVVRASGSGSATRDLAPARFAAAVAARRARRRARRPLAGRRRRVTQFEALTAAAYSELARPGSRSR